MPSLRFEIDFGSPAIKGHPSYATEDHAFDFEMDFVERTRMESGRGTTSFVTGTLQLEVRVDDLQCLYLWGYCPQMGWRQSVLSPPAPSIGILRAVRHEPLIPGVSIDITKMVSATPFFDPSSGWFCMGNKDAVSEGQAVEFATGTRAVVHDGRLLSLWVKPDNWTAVAEKVRGSKQLQAG